MNSPPPVRPRQPADGAAHAIHLHLVAIGQGGEHAAQLDHHPQRKRPRHDRAVGEITPVSTTSPPAFKKSGVYPGSVDGATRISPGASHSHSDGWRSTRTFPRATHRKQG